MIKEIENFDQINRGDIFYTIEEFGIVEVCFITKLDDLYFKTKNEDDIGLFRFGYNNYNELHFGDFKNYFYQNKVECEKIIIKNLIEELKVYKKYKNKKTISLNTINVKDGDQLFYVFDKINCIKVKVIYNEDGELYFIDDDIPEYYYCDGELFKDEKSANRKIFENICLKLENIFIWEKDKLINGIQSYKFDENEIVYYFEDYEIKSKKMKKGERFKGIGFLYEKHALEYQKKILQSVIDEIDWKIMNLKGENK